MATDPSMQDPFSYDLGNQGTFETSSPEQRQLELGVKGPVPLGTQAPQPGILSTAGQLLTASSAVPTPATPYLAVAGIALQVFGGMFSGRAARKEQRRQSEIEWKRRKQELQMAIDARKSKFELPSVSPAAIAQQRGA